jgi:hypothetical protein
MATSIGEIPSIRRRLLNVSFFLENGIRHIQGAHLIRRREEFISRLEPEERKLFEKTLKGMENQMAKNLRECLKS